ncbi:hypothetical protein SLEP1_g27875 [Rubroshorea leprosula]|uniref:Uncharacterized protein n=1 Tax=Rubroshorea leprosula TaxID=152421 RepID=A0AAV5JXE0_9ROSI|nr:hypothetical protein SLEP1_g27875 [Rubroshorea leprosula]
MNRQKAEKNKKERTERNLREPTTSALAIEEEIRGGDAIREVAQNHGGC